MEATLIANDIIFKEHEDCLILPAGVQAMPEIIESVEDFNMSKKLVCKLVI